MAITVHSGEFALSPSVETSVERAVEEAVNPYDDVVDRVEIHLLPCAHEAWRCRAHVMFRDGAEAAWQMRAVSVVAATLVVAQALGNAVERHRARTTDFPAPPVQFRRAS